MITLTTSHRFALCLSLLVTGSLGLQAAARTELVYYPRQNTPHDNGTPLTAPDKDAHKGIAQAAIPGKSKKGDIICSLYSYARPAGHYRITWRLKVLNNQGDKPVFSASAFAGKRFKGGSIKLRPNQFKQAGVYQEFSFTAEKNEGGYFVVRASWEGGPEVHVDWIKVTLEKPFTDRELLARRGGIKLPDDWNLPRNLPLHIHLGKGLWWTFFGLREAIGEVGGAVVTCSYFKSGRGGRSLRLFPTNWQGLAQNNIVMLANVDASALHARGRILLEDFVQKGGGLLIFGGPYAFKRGGYAHTALEQLIPCTLTAKDWQKAPKNGLILQPGPDAKTHFPANLAWSLQPRLYYFHELTPRPDAEVWATAGDHPILITGTAGKGRVAVFAGTAQGMPENGQLPFWQWGDMPRLVAATLRWLAAAPRDIPVSKITKKDLETLAKLAMPAPANEDAERQRQLSDLLARCRNTDFARQLLQAVISFEQAPAYSFIEKISDAVRPLITAKFADIADELINTRDPARAALGIRLLGMFHRPEERKRIEDFLRRGTAALPPIELAETASLDSLSASMGTTLQADGEQQIKLAAVLALGDLNGTKAIPALQKTTQEFSTKRQKMFQILPRFDLNENIYQQSLAMRCRLGDGTAAAPFLAALIHNDNEISQFQNSLDVMLINPDDKELRRTRRLAGKRLPLLHRRQTLCMNALLQVPYSMAADFAQALITRDDAPELIPFALAALSPTARRKPNAETAAGLLPLLQNCPFPEIRRLAFRLLKDTQNPELLRRTGDILIKLAASDNIQAVRFALGLIPQLPPETRQKIIAAARQQPNPAIRALADNSAGKLAE